MTIYCLTSNASYPESKLNAPTHQGLEMCNEVQRHLNRVMADVTESAKPFEDADYWEGTVYGKILRLKREDYD